MKAERCKYLPNCKARAVDHLGTIPICDGCQALRRMQAREEAKKIAKAALPAVAVPKVVAVPEQSDLVPC